MKVKRTLSILGIIIVCSLLLMVMWGWSLFRAFRSATSGPTITVSEETTFIEVPLDENGRVILSSLERDEDTGRQYIHWQRCSGGLDRSSDYGDDGDNNGLGISQIEGMGVPGRLISAPSGTAVMFAEIFFQFDRLFDDIFVGDTSFKKEAAFLVRDDRNLTPGVTGNSGTSLCS